jgi:hypothetical protein
MKKLTLAFAAFFLFQVGACSCGSSDEATPDGAPQADAPPQPDAPPATGTDNCGNQFGYGAGDDADDPYGFLAGALAADVLVIDATQTTCTQYLALEAGVADDCGGRTPVMDVIETTYSAVAAGVLSGVNDGVDADDCPHKVAADDFPFLTAPMGNDTLPGPACPDPAL